MLWDMRKAIFGLGGAQVLGTGLAIAAASLALGPALAARPWPSASSWPCPPPRSCSRRWTRRVFRQGPVGRAAFGVLLLQDLAVIPLFALLPLLATGAPQHPTETNGGHGGGSLVALTYPSGPRCCRCSPPSAAVVGGGRYLVRPAVPLHRQGPPARDLRRRRPADRGGRRQPDADRSASPPPSAPSWPGVVLAESEFRRELETDIEPFRGLLLGLFFITVGAGVNLPLVAQPASDAWLGLVIGLMAAEVPGHVRPGPTVRRAETGRHGGGHGPGSGRRVRLRSAYLHGRRRRHRRAAGRAVDRRRGGLDGLHPAGHDPVRARRGPDGRGHSRRGPRHRRLRRRRARHHHRRLRPFRSDHGPPARPPTASSRPCWTAISNRSSCCAGSAGAFTMATPRGSTCYARPAPIAPGC